MTVTRDRRFPWRYRVTVPIHDGTYDASSMFKGRAWRMHAGLSTAAAGWEAKRQHREQAERLTRLEALLPGESGLGDGT